MLLLFGDGLAAGLFDINDISSSKNFSARPLLLKSVRVGHNKLVFPIAKTCFLFPFSSNFDLMFLYLRCLLKDLLVFLFLRTSQLVPTSRPTSSLFYLWILCCSNLSKLSCLWITRFGSENLMFLFLDPSLESNIDLVWETSGETHLSGLLLVSGLW